MKRITHFGCRLVGRRGLFMILFGMRSILYGVSIIVRPDKYNIYPSYLLSWDHWAWIGITLGAICILSAFTRKARVSFALAAGVCAFWAIKWFHIAYFYPASDAWTSGASWAIMAGIIVLVSSWPEIHRKDIFLPPMIDKETDSP